MKSTSSMGKRLIVCVALAVGLLCIAGAAEGGVKRKNAEHIYPVLPSDESASAPLAHLNDEGYADPLFSTNLPVVIISWEHEPQIYKTFSGGNEQVDTSVEPWVTGSMELIKASNGRSYLKDTPKLQVPIQIKRRGHTSMAFDKPQYYIKTVDASDVPSEVSFLGMGQGSRWVLCGSMADKSMLRNYLAYRISWELGGGGFAPECRFCEVFIRERDGKNKYMGVYLLLSAVSRGEGRIDIPEYNVKESYTSYILRRDRYTSFDKMLETYGRIQGFSDTWLGVKYPTSSKLNDEIVSYITRDFSGIEQVLYSDDPDVFLNYRKWIDVQSFVDYFLINEFFGNYDAGLHSTYYYKAPREKLKIGPVWDFDQATNNYYAEEMNPESIAFHTRTFYAQLVNDRAFVKKLKNRYAALRKRSLSEQYINALIEEAVQYLKSAQVREWYRWRADYEDSTGRGGKNYVLKSYRVDGEELTRFHTDYKQELRVIRVYLSRHGAYIQEGLSNLLREASLDSGIGSQGEFFSCLTVLALLLTGIFVIRKG